MPSISKGEYVFYWSMLVLWTVLGALHVWLLIANMAQGDLYWVINALLIVMSVYFIRVDSRKITQYQRENSGG